MGSVWMRNASLSELVGCIYQAGMEPERWPRVLESAAAQFRAQVAMLWTHDFSTNSIYLPNTELSSMVGIDDAAARAFKSHYYAMNVWVPRSANLQEGCTVLSSELYPETQLASTEFYADWLRPLDLYHAIGSAVIKEASRHVKLSFVRSRRAGAFTDDERRCMAFLLPHVRNAFLLHRQLGSLRALGDSAFAALDRLSIGVVLLTSSGHIVHVNAAAKKAVERTRSLSLTGRVTCTVGSDTAALRKLISEATLTGAGAGVRSAGAMKLRGLAGEMNVVVTPLHRTHDALSEFATAAVFCTVPGERARGMTEILRNLHQLTHAEAVVASSLLEGLSLKEIAERRNITIHTVRSQLKSVCSKTGTRRQANLVRVLCETLPLTSISS